MSTFIHIIDPGGPFVRWIYDYNYTWAVEDDGTYTQVPVSPGTEEVGPIYVLPYWVVFEGFLEVGGPSRAYAACNHFVDASGNVWLVGYATYDPDDPPNLTSPQYFAMRWNPSTETTDPIWTCTPTNGSHGPLGLMSACDAPGGGIYASTSGNEFGGLPAIVYWPGTGTVATTLTSDYRTWYRTANALSSGDIYSGHDLEFIDPDTGTFTAPYWIGAGPSAIFAFAGSYWVLSRGVFYWQINPPPYPIEQLRLPALWRCDTNPHDPESWGTGSLVRILDNYDLDTLTAGSSWNVYGPWAEGEMPTLWPQLFDGKMFIAMGINIRNSSFGYAVPAYRTAVWCLESSGTLSRSFEVPYPSNEIFSGPLCVLNDTLYTVTSEGWASGTSVTVRLWQLAAGGSTTAWTEATHWTRTRSQWQQPLFSSMLSTGGYIYLAVDNTANVSGSGGPPATQVEVVRWHALTDTWEVWSTGPANTNFGTRLFFDGPVPA